MLNFFNFTKVSLALFDFYSTFYSVRHSLDIEIKLHENWKFFSYENSSFTHTNTHTRFFHSAKLTFIKNKEFLMNLWFRKNMCRSGCYFLLFYFFTLKWRREMPKGKMKSCEIVIMKAETNIWRCLWIAHWTEFKKVHIDNFFTFFAIWFLLPLRSFSFSHNKFVILTNYCH